RVGFQLRAHRRLEVDLFAPGLGARLERRSVEHGTRGRGIPQFHKNAYCRSRKAELHPFSAALQAERLPPDSNMPSMALPRTWPLNSPLRPARRNVTLSPRSTTSSSGTSRPSIFALPETRVSCWRSDRVAGARLTAGGICAVQLPATLAGTT